MNSGKLKLEIVVNQLLYVPIVYISMVILPIKLISYIPTIKPIEYASINRVVVISIQAFMGMELVIIIPLVIPYLILGLA